MRHDHKRDLPQGWFAIYDGWFVLILKYLGRIVLSLADNASGPSEVLERLSFDLLHLMALGGQRMMDGYFWQRYSQ